MKVYDFDFLLPDKYIAQTPLDKRDDSRLLVLDRKTGEIYHALFSHILDFLNPGDVLVLNDSKVIPARLIGNREETGGRVEFLLLTPLGDDKWEVLVKPGKKAREGTIISFGEGRLKARILSTTDSGGRIVRFEYKGDFEKILDLLGRVPLPPYIKQEIEDKDRYQTVYAKNPGSVAAPTAGLHFTPSLLQRAKEKGIKIAYVTLHIGLGTFRPVTVTDIKDHNMHKEFYIISTDNTEIINKQKESGGRVVAVGTTACRVLETCASNNGLVKERKGWTDIFIYPGYDYKIVDCLITNFHLPKSTLIMLVSALAGREKILKAYQEAINKEYRFFSFGDAMLIK